MQRCRVKICGITSVSDALMVCEAGVDAIGLVFYAKSARYVTCSLAKEICQALPPFVAKVGLFLDAPEYEVQSTIQQVPLDVLQFHGKESPAYCQGFAMPYIKAIGMQNKQDLAQWALDYPDAQGFLMDSHALGAAGGTGQTFDWTQIPSDCSKPLILAGGLTIDNIAIALRSAPVYALDLSSGVESAPGVKDAQKVKRFMQAVYQTL